jgi:hypothetical protein
VFVLVIIAIWMYFPSIRQGVGEYQLPDVVVGKIQGRQRPIVGGVSADARRGYSRTYVHLGRKAATMMAPDAPRPLALKSASAMEISIVTGLLS